MKKNNDPLIVALLHELDGYEKRGMNDRADCVRAELKRLGHSRGEAPAVERAVAPAPEKRAPSRRTRARKGS